MVLGAGLEPTANGKNTQKRNFLQIINFYTFISFVSCITQYHINPPRKSGPTPSEETIHAPGIGPQKIEQPPTGTDSDRRPP